MYAQDVELRIKKGQPALVLAPMEGVTDAPMRALQAERGGFSFCVSEFLRVSQELPPARSYLEHVPEFRAGCLAGGVLPVGFQLLGGDPEKLAQSALRAVELGARAIDLNFGCPAPTVNRHDGGATLLKFPHRIRAIVEAVRRAVPRPIPVSAKMRLGWDNPDPVHENAERAAEGGADWITIHGRTKMQGYAPPAYWEPIGEVNRRLGIPVIANGDLWTLDDLRRCRDVTGCEHFMLGRSALADPALPRAAAHELGIALFPAEDRVPFGEDRVRWREVLAQFARHNLAAEPREGYTVRRIKQWVRMAHLRFGVSWFDSLKTAEALPQVFDSLSPINKENRSVSLNNDNFIE